MKYSLFNLLSVALVFSAVSITSCSESDDAAIVSLENYVNGEMDHLHRSHALGKHGCYELVYPVTLELPNGTQVVAASAEELRDAIKAWKESDGATRRDRPTFVYPIQVMDDDGNLIDIESADAFKDLRSSCRRDRAHGHLPCFKPVFPLTFEIEDGITITAETAEDLRTFIQDYKVDHPRKRVKLHLVFPITVEYADGTQVSVASREELKALKEACSDE